MEYGLVYIGTPTWAAKPAPAIITMIDKCNLKGKDIILFSTMGSSGGSKAIERMREKVEARGGRMVNSFSIKTVEKKLKILIMKPKRSLKKWILKYMEFKIFE